MFGHQKHVDVVLARVGATYISQCLVTSIKKIRKYLTLDYTVNNISCSAPCSIALDVHLQLLNTCPLNNKGGLQLFRCIVIIFINENVLV